MRAAPVAALARDEPRWSSSQPSPGRGSSSASSPRPPGSTGRRSPTAVEQAARERDRRGAARSRSPPCRFTHELVRRAVYDRIPRVRRRSCTSASARRSSRSTRPISRASCPSSPTTSRSPLRSPAPSARSTTTCARPRPRRRRRPTAKRRRGSRRALELGIADPRERARVQVELGHLFYETGRLAESDAILAASLDAATEPGGARPRGACARPALEPAAGLGSRGRARRRWCRSPRRRSGRSSSSATRSASRWPSTCSAHALGREGRRAESARGARAGARPRGGRRRRGHAAPHHRADRRGLCERPDPGRRGDRPPRGAPVVEPRRPGARRGAPPLPRAASSRWPAASTRRASTSRRATASSTSAVETDFVAARAAWTRRRGKGARRRPRRRRAANCRPRSSACATREARTGGASAAGRRPARAALCDQGRWDEAAAYLAYGGEVDGASRSQGKIYSMLPPRRQGPRWRRSAGELAEALELARRAVELADRGRLAELPEPAPGSRSPRCSARSGQTAEADAAVATALALYEQKGNVAAAARLRADRADRRSADRSVAASRTVRRSVASQRRLTLAFASGDRVASASARCAHGRGLARGCCGRRCSARSASPRAPRGRRTSDTITLSMLADRQRSKPGYDVLIANFERVYPNINVNVTYAANDHGSDQLETTELAAGNAPDVLATCPGCGTPISVCTLAKAGHLAPMVKKPWAKRSRAARDARSTSTARDSTPSRRIVTLVRPLHERRPVQEARSEGAADVPAAARRLSEGEGGRNDRRDPRPARARPDVTYLLDGPRGHDRVREGQAVAAKLEGRRRSTFAGSAGWHQALQEFVDMNRRGLLPARCRGHVGAPRRTRSSRRDRA